MRLRQNKLVFYLLFFCHIRVFAQLDVLHLKSNVADTIFGHVVPDPYRWMEDLGSDSLKQWLQAQKEITDNESGKFKKSVSSAKGDIHDFSSFSVNDEKKTGGWYFQRMYGAFAGNSSPVLYYRQSLNEPYEVAFDPNDISKTAYSIDDWAVSEGGQYLAVTNDITQSITIDTRNGGYATTVSPETYSESDDNILDAAVYKLEGYSEKAAGPGDRQRGGWHLTDKEGGPDPTKAGSQYTAEEIKDAGAFIKAVGGLTTIDKPDVTQMATIAAVAKQVVKAFSAGNEGTQKVADVADAAGLTEKAEQKANAGESASQLPKTLKKCPSCNQMKDSTHIDTNNGKGTYDSTSQ